MGLFDLFRSGTPEERFGRDVVEAMKKRGAPASIRFLKDEFAIQMSESSRFNLHNVYRMWSEAPDKATKAGEMERIVAFGLSTLEEPDNSWEAVKPLLMPAIRNRAHITCEWTVHTGESPDFEFYKGVTRPIGDEYLALLTVNRELGIQAVSAKTLEEDWPVSFDEAWAIAMENLRAASPAKFVRADEGFHISDYGDWYDSARLLLPHLFQSLNLKGDPVVVPMSRTVLLVAGSEDEQALKGMDACIRVNFQHDQRPTGLAPVIYERGAWRSAAGLSPVMDGLSAVHRDWNYADQKANLDDYFSRTGRDVFVASVGVVDGQDGSPMTWSSWFAGVATLLPRSDVIVVGAENEKHMPRLWEDVEAICGPFVEEPGVYPPLYVAPDGPTPAQRQRLLAIDRPANFPRANNPRTEA